MTTTLKTNPQLDCQICPRLAGFRDANRVAHPDFFNGPVPIWGGNPPKLVIVGLAPGLKGANRTGRPFTGDYAGDLLFQTLERAGKTSGTYAQHADDGFELDGVIIVNAVRCVPPQNKPTGPEIANCRPFLKAKLDELGGGTMLALGRIAHESVLTTLGARRASFPFKHSAQHQPDDDWTLFDSYHCSRYNTNTRRLTEEMFEEVVFKAIKHAFSH